MFCSIRKADFYEENDIFLWDIAAEQSWLKRQEVKFQFLSQQKNFVLMPFSNGLYGEVKSSDSVAVTSRSFSQNEVLVNELRNHFSKVKLNETGETLKENL